MLINRLVALALATLGFAALWHQLKQLLWPESGIDPAISFGLLLSIVLIVLAIGLFRRHPYARVVILGLALAGMAQLVIMPLQYLIGFFERDSLREEIGLALAIGADLPQHLPVFGAHAGSMAQGFVPAMMFSIIVLTAIGLGSNRLYRYYQRPDVAVAFATRRVFSMADARTGLGLEELGVGLIFVILITVSDRFIPLPATESSPTASVGADFIRQVHFSQDGRSIAIASKHDELILIQIPTQRVQRLSKQLFTLWGATSTAPSRLDQQFSPDLRYFVSRHGEVLDVTNNGRLRLPVSATASEQPLGLLRESGQALYFIRDPARLVVASIQHEAPLYSIEATRSAWLLGSEGREVRRELWRASGNTRELVYHVLEGRFSPDRRHYLYVYNRRLHVLDVAKGALTIPDATVDPVNAIEFSDDGQWAMVYARGDREDREPGILYNLKTGEWRDHGFGGQVSMFSLPQDRVITYERNTITQTSLSSPALTKWRVVLPAGSVWLFDPHAQRLWVRRPDQAKIEYVEVESLRGETPPVFQGIATRLTGFGTLRQSPDGKTLVLTQGPLLELIDVSGSKPKPQSSLIDISAVGN